MKDEEDAEESFFDELSQFIEKNKDFLTQVLGKWAQQSSRQFYAKTIAIIAVLVSSSTLCGFGKINGETFAGIVGVLLGYILGKGVL